MDLIFIVLADVPIRYNSTHSQLTCFAKYILRNSNFFLGLFWVLMFFLQWKKSATLAAKETYFSQELVETKNGAKRQRKFDLRPTDGPKNYSKFTLNSSYVMAGCENKQLLDYKFFNKFSDEDMSKCVHKKCKYWRENKNKCCLSTFYWWVQYQHFVNC